MRYAIALAAALILNAAANLMMRSGMKRVDADGGLLREGLTGGVASIVTSPILLIGLLCFAMNAPCYMYALQKIKVSMAYPVMVGGGFAIIALVAWAYLGERLGIGGWVGVALILAGVVLVARQPAGSG